MAILALAAFLTQTLSSTQGLAAAPPASIAKRPGDWAYSYSDVVPDPAVRFGTLSNGVRYVLQRNAAKDRKVALRLRISVGSMHESDRQRGYAHLLEHMAFRGGRNIPNGEITKRLQDLGVSGAADLDAYTDRAQTIYRLNIPNNDIGSIDLGLSFYQDVARSLTIAPKELEKEMRIVLSEARLRDTAARGGERFFEQFLFQGDALTGRPVVGDPADIRSATSDQLKRFYRNWYRPERTMIVMTGDIDLDMVEREIARRFSNWPAMPPPREDGAVPRSPAPQAEARVASYSAAGLTQSVRAAWRRPYDPSADTVAREQLDLARAVGFAIVNEQLATLSDQGGSAVGRAIIHRDNDRIKGQVTTLDVYGAENHWDAAVKAALIVHRQMLAFGPTTEEIERHLARLQAGHEFQVRNRQSVTASAIADHLLEDAAEDEIPTSPEQNLERFLSFRPSITADVVKTAYAASFGTGPAVMLLSPQALEQGEVRLRSALSAGQTEPVGPPPQVQHRPWPFRHDFPIGQISKREAIADLGVETITFTNGLRLHLKRTAFSAGSVSVAARFERGLLDLSPAQAAPLWTTTAFIQGGTSALPLEDIWKSRPGASLSVNFRVAENGSTLGGDTRRQDLQSELELLLAYATSPGFRVETFELSRSAARSLSDASRSTPWAVFNRDNAQWAHAGDMRWSSSFHKAVVDATTVETFKGLIKPILDDGVVELSIVGDFDLEETIQAVAATFGGWPNRNNPGHLQSLNVPPVPQGVRTPIIAYHRGAADKAVAAVEWRTTGFYSDPHLARVVSFGAAILKDRIVNRLRTQEGFAYAPSVVAVSSSVLEDFGYLYAGCEVAPGQGEYFRNVVVDMAKHIAQMPPSADEMTRVRATFTETFKKEEQSNAYWINRLFDLDRDPRVLDAIRTRTKDTASVTSEEIRQTFERLFKRSLVRTIDILPEPNRAAP